MRFPHSLGSTTRTAALGRDVGGSWQVAGTAAWRTVDYRLALSAPLLLASMTHGVALAGMAAVAVFGRGGCGENELLTCTERSIAPCIDHMQAAALASDGGRCFGPLSGVAVAAGGVAAAAGFGSGLPPAGDGCSKGGGRRWGEVPALGLFCCGVVRSPQDLRGSWRVTREGRGPRIDAEAGE